MKDKIVRHLRNLIKNASLNYNNGFSWSDVKLTDEFKEAYSDYLERNKRGFSIEYNDYTSIVTTSSSLLVFIPNQWFAMAVYAKEVCRELLKYKDYFDRVVQYSCVNANELAKSLRATADKHEILKFSENVRNVLNKEYRPYEDKEIIDEAVKYITEFATNYDWWSGNKTIDRTDFYISVVLNMLGLVIVSQGYVADIVYAYCNDEKLDSITKEIASFTVDLGDNSTWVSYDDEYDFSNGDEDSFKDEFKEKYVEKKPSYNVIHISGTKKKEIKIKI